MAAATEAIAELGLGVSTSKIAQLAGVAEGSLFTYFTTKETLFNELYVELKLKEREEFMQACRTVLVTFGTSLFV